MNPYRKAIECAAEPIDDEGRQMIRSETVNAVAILWAWHERGVNLLKGSDQGRQVYPA